MSTRLTVDVKVNVNASECLRVILLFAILFT